MLEYVSDGGYHYRQMSNGHVARIGSRVSGGGEHNSPPKPNQYVTIIVKPYVAKKYVTGIVKRVLTRKKIHTRGHKVMLTDGTVGRIV
jgi:uncharacterized repeat protein (TIGR03833 family)